MPSIKSYCWICHLPVWQVTIGICSWCQRHLPALPVVCYRCALPAATFYPECGRCLLHPPAWQWLICVGPYQSPLNKLIHLLKFKRQTTHAVMLARLILLSYLQYRRRLLLPTPDLLLSVPLHHHRHWFRGFNQTILLASPLAHWLACPYWPYAIQRHRATSRQHRLSRRQRTRNTHQAFTLTQSVRGKHILLLDDVVTTGNTATAIAQQLTDSGAKTIQLCCVCRTL